MKQEFKQYVKTFRCFSNSLPQDCKSSGAGVIDGPRKEKKPVRYPVGVYVYLPVDSPVGSPYSPPSTVTTWTLGGVLTIGLFILLLPVGL
jgi:hypothetical protein